MLSFMKEKKDIISKAERYQDLILAKDKLDIYDAGFFNGVEAVLSELEGRKPGFILYQSGDDILNEPEPEKTRTKGGMLKCQSGKR